MTLSFDLFTRFLIYYRNEFFLADYLYKLGNYNTDYTVTALSTEGYTDWHMADAATVQGSTTVQNISI